MIYTKPYKRVADKSAAQEHFDYALSSEKRCSCISMTILQHIRYSRYEYIADYMCNSVLLPPIFNKQCGIRNTIWYTMHNSNIVTYQYIDEKYHIIVNCRVTIWPISELTGEGTFSFTCLSFIDERVCILKTAYPFIKHIPVVIVMSISYFSICAGMCLAGKATRFHLLFSV